MMSSLLKTILILSTGFLFTVSVPAFTFAFTKQKIEAESSEYIGQTKKIANIHASEGNVVSLTKTGDGIIFKSLSDSDKLAIRYSSLGVGVLEVVINNEPIQQVNIHSSGDLTSSFLFAIINVEIPSDAELTVRLTTGDLTVNIDYILLGNGDLGLPPDIWNLPSLPIAEGPFSSDWKEISRIYTVPEWWREAKFGAWSHWSPQSMPEQGDWYARGMYMEGHPQYEYHIEHFGHPSEYGYKDIAHNWVIDKWNPEELMDLYVEMGARYFMAMGVHHDNFDNWDSKYQPWNSVNVGPKVDIVGIYEKNARDRGLRFGIGFHNTPARTWGQFMTVRYTSDKSGPMKGVPYDALQTIADGEGTWWKGMDPVDLYGPVHDKRDPLHSPFANQFMWRVDDAITKYKPDIIYFDEHAGDSQVDLGVNMGLGFLAPQLIANYYNKSLNWNDGKLEAVINLKGVGGRWDSFQNNPELLPFVDRALVKSTEFHIEPDIMAYPFQTETSISEWHYRTGQEYLDAKEIVTLLLENVSRNGTMLLNLTQHDQGHLDPEVIQIAKDIGAWLDVNVEAIYGSRPFEVYGEENVRYTRNNGFVYATMLDWKDSVVTLNSLYADGSTIGEVSKVELLGSEIEINFEQDENGLTIMPKNTAMKLSDIADLSLAAGTRVLRISHDKGWFNDDDPGVVAPGWFRKSNLGTGDFNNDLTISNTPGAEWTATFTGSAVSVIAPKENGAGTFEIKIDGKSFGVVDLSVTGERQAQQFVLVASDLNESDHTITIIHRGSGTVAIDALIIN